MKTTRRGLLGWLGALFGGAAVARVAPAEAEPESPAMTAGRLAARRDATLVERGERPLGLDNHRRTGRTTRDLLAAIEEARAGERIAYIVGHPLMVEDALDLVQRHAQAHVGYVLRPNNSSRRVDIGTCAGGTLALVAPGSASNLRGMGVTAVHFDHALHYQVDGRLYWELRDWAERATYRRGLG